MRTRYLRKVIHICVSAMLWIMSTFVIVHAYSGNGYLIVHVTDYGDCYHKAGCGSLWNSDNEMSLEAAYIAGYSRCERCNPPVYTGTAVRGSLKKNTRSSSSSSGGQRNTGAGESSSRSQRETNAALVPVLGVGGALAAGGVTVKIVKDSRRRREEEKRRQQETAARIKMQQEYELRRKQQEEEAQRRREQAREKRRQYYENNYKGRSIREIVGAPPDVCIDRNGVVTKGKVTNEYPFGDLTVFVSGTGKCYHKNRSCRNAFKMTPINVFDAYPRGYNACTFCVAKKEVPPDWYKEIPKVLQTISEFEWIEPENERR